MTDSASSGHDKQHAITQITKQATTGTAITPSPDGWVSVLPELDGVACEWQCEDSLLDSYLWFEDGAFRAADLPPGLEDREGRELDRFEAAALLEGGVFHKPVDMSEVDQ